MPTLSEHDNDPPAQRGKASFVIPALIVVIVIAMVVLHIAGVFGPGSH